MNTQKKEAVRFIKFLFFSLSAGIIELGSFTLLNEFVFPEKYWPCYITALVLSVVWNFTLNREFTFKSATNIPVAMMKVLAYYAVFTPVTTVLGSYLADGLGWNEYIVTLLNMVLNLVTEFIYQRYFVFGKSLDTKQTAKKEE